ncbi:hypothetical protein JI435_126780, partial [Parastagonospora nodorum SN15]
IVDVVRAETSRGIYRNASVAAMVPPTPTLGQPVENQEKTTTAATQRSPQQFPTTSNPLGNIDKHRNIQARQIYWRARTRRDKLFRGAGNAASRNTLQRAAEMGTLGTILRRSYLDST